MNSLGMIQRSWNDAIRLRKSPNGSFSLNVTCFPSPDAVIVSTTARFALFGEIEQSTFSTRMYVGVRSFRHTKRSMRRPKMPDARTSQEMRPCETRTASSSSLPSPIGALERADKTRTSLLPKQ